MLRYKVSGSDFSRAGEASSSVKKALKKLGFPPEVVRRVAIALYEGEINMVIHANGGVVTAEIYADKVVLNIKDDGPGIPDIGLAMRSGYSTADEHIRSMGFGAGMGLPNMQGATDSIEIETTVGVGTTVKMTVLNP